MLMRKTSIFAAAVVALLASGAQAKSRDPGPPDHRDLTPGRFDSIAVAGPFVVRVHAGKATKVALTGPRTMLDDTELVIRDGQLIIRWQEGASWSRNGNQGVDVDIDVPVIRGVINVGAGSIEIDRVKADRFVATLASAGSVSIRSIDVGQLKADLMGAGSLQAAGQVGTANLTLGSSGSFDNPNLTVRDADITSAGSGSVRATVTKAAKIESSGSGGTILTGGAKCNVSKAGSGNVRCS
jgi:hypothetical protein